MSDDKAFFWNALSDVLTDVRTSYHRIDNFYSGDCMNERITQLALEASDPKTGWLDRQKFAELIVKECAWLIETRESRTEPAPHIYLLKVFGVEE